MKSSKNKIYLSIVVPTYNRLYSLKKFLLPSLNVQNYIDFELIIIDDASSDKTLSYLKSPSFKKEFKNISRKTIVLSNKKNLGAPSSRNIGVLKARGKWIFIAEDDIEIKDTSFLSKAIAETLKLNKKVVILSPMRLETNNSGYYPGDKGTHAKIGRITGEIYIDPTQRFSGYVPTTHATVFIDKKIYEKYKEDSDTFTHNTFRDETDLYKRIVDDGFKIKYVGSSLVTFHRNDFSLTGGQKKINNYSLIRQELVLLSNHYRYLKKYYSHPKIRAFLFFILRMMKIFSNKTGLIFIKRAIYVIGL